MIYTSVWITIYALFLSALAGACTASFLNCMAWRIVNGESVIKGRSHCDKCGHTLNFPDLIPILSYIFSRGKCRYCGEKLSKKHLIYEIIGAVAFMSIVLKFDISLDALEYILFISILMGASFTDIEDYLIPDRFILAGIVLRAVFLAIDFINSRSVTELVDSLIGGFAISLLLLAVVLVFEKIIKREAMGGGDIKLIFVIGLFLGWKKNLLSLFLACIIGIITGVVTADKRENDDTLEDKKIFPWGPGLALAAYITTLFGDTVINWYLGLF